MLKDKQLLKLVDFIDSRDCFPDADIAGGVCYFLRDMHHKGNCLFIHNSNGKTSEVLKSLDNYNIFLRHPLAEDIVNKIKAKTEIFFDDIVSSRKPFGLATNAQIQNEGDLLIKYNKGLGKFNRKNVPSGKEMIDEWNVIISYLSAEHDGQPDKNGQFKILSSLDLLPPQTICTETYLVAFSSKSEDIAKAVFKYFETKFLRYLVSIVAISQHVTKACFQFVPLQDFTENSDINWSKNIEEIDQQLYRQYGLSDTEISFIESMIKPM